MGVASEVSQAACDIYSWFGHVPSSMFTLFTLVTVEGWPDLAEVVLNADFGGSPFFAIFFVVFIMFTNIALLNLVTGVIVDQVLTIARRDEIEKVQKEEKERLRIL